MSRSVYVSKPSCYAPGLESEEDWKLWKAGKKSIEQSTKSPALEFTPPLFRRRLGQLCRMVIQVVHSQIELTGCGDIKQFFTSTYGEITREFQSNKMLFEDKALLPASFSMSVFNAPIALADIACKLKSGYTVAFPSKGNFSDSFLCAAAEILSGKESELLFVYGDELVPLEYGELCPVKNEPLAFAVIISARQEYEGAKEICLPLEGQISAADFLKLIL